MSDFSWEAAPLLLSDHIAWVELTPSTPCLRVGHPGSYILPVATVVGSGIDGGPNQSEGNSVLRNHFGKRASLSVEGC